MLDSVTLSENVKNDAMYMNRRYNVKVNAYSIQSTAEAVKDSTKGEIYGAYGEQNGFGLSDAKYSKLARALEIVAKSPASNEGQLPNSTNPGL